MRVALWIPKTAYTHSEYVALIAFSLQQWLHEHTSMLRYTYIACLVCINLHISAYEGDGLASLLSKSLTFLKPLIQVTTVSAI